MTQASRQLVLGVEGGATKTEWILADSGEDRFAVLEQGRLGPGNLALLDTEGLRALLNALPAGVSRTGIFLAGCAGEADRQRLQTAARERWPDASVISGSDRDSGYAAALGGDDGIHVIAGTGSAVTGRRLGQEDQSGGWGHLLGDSGGGYDLALHALRHILFDYDTARRISPFAANVLDDLGLNTLRDLNAWAQTAQKPGLARLTPLVFAHAQDPAIRQILEDGAISLARRVEAVFDRLNFKRAAIRLCGGVFISQPFYADLFRRHFSRPGDIEVSRTPGSHGAARLACGTLPKETAHADESQLFGQASTEQPNPRSAGLSEMNAEELVGLFVREERYVENALAGAVPALARAIQKIAAALSAGGRLFYVGAGTSGRLGVLDASEIPPTFGLPPDRVQAIMAGGLAAVTQSVEGAEDDAAAGGEAVHDRGIESGDVVCGLTASGRTPFVRGALAAAQSLGCTTIFITCNPRRAALTQPAAVEIDLATGPELLTGSTRLKAGTATKVALNILTTGTMVQLGRVQGNLMIGMRPSNEKLRSRAARIVASLLRTDEPTALERLERSNWNIEAALRGGG